jgi:hypothetical protein
VFGPGPSAPRPNPEDYKYRRPTSLGTSIVYQPVTDPGTIARLDSIYDLYHSFDGTGNLVGLLNSIRGAGGTLYDLEILSGFFYNDWVRAARSVGISPFANGGAFTGNGVVKQPSLFNIGMMGEAGPEAILPLTSVGGRLGVHAVNSNSNNEELEKRVENLSIELQAIAVNTSKVARILERVTRDGESLLTTNVT